MKLPYPSSFARTSPTARICEHIEDASKGQSTGHAPPLDLRTLFDLPHERFPRETARSPALASMFRPLWDAATGTKTIFLPLIMNGQPVVRRNKAGELKPVKFPVEIQTCAVTVTVERGSFVLSATSRGNNIHDSRDDSRKPMALHRSDLRRLFPADADCIAERLANALPGLRVKKPRPLHPLSAAERARVAKLVAARDQEDKARAAHRSAIHTAKMRGASLT